MGVILMTFIHHLFVVIGIGLGLAALLTFGVGIVTIKPDRQGKITGWDA